jgi:hypothetical protein
MTTAIEPEPTDEEREAILAALRGTVPDEPGWSAAALREGVADDELDP